MLKYSLKLTLKIYITNYELKKETNKKQRFIYAINIINL
jgi:hypothetical protein